MTINNNKVLLATLFISISTHAGTFYLLQPTHTLNSWVLPGQIHVNVLAVNSKITLENKNSDNDNTKDTINPVSSPVKDTARSTQKTGSGNARLKYGNENLTQENNTTGSLANKLTVQLRGKIKTALQKHLTYPQIARRRGWQGTVTIYVTIMSNGDLRQVKLGNSSGYTLLDDSAINALRKVGKLDELEPLLQGKTIPIELPIKFLLKDPVYGVPSA